MSACPEAGEGVVTFNVGGERFELLEQTVRSRGDTLLRTLLDDPGRDKHQDAIFVEGNAKLFPFILDWYRYGTICIPSLVSLAQIRRECAFFQLPDDVAIKRERVVDVMVELDKETSESWRKAKDNVEACKNDLNKAGCELAAALSYLQLLETMRANRTWETTSDVSDLLGPKPVIQEPTSTNATLDCSCGTRWCVKCRRNLGSRMGTPGYYVSMSTVQAVCPECQQRQLPASTPTEDNYVWYKKERDLETIAHRVAELAAADGWEFKADCKEPARGTLRIPAEPLTKRRSIML